MRVPQPVSICRRSAVFIAVMGLTGCHRDMRDQPRYEPLEASEVFADGQSTRPFIAGTVARGTLHPDEAFQTGKVKGRFITHLPVKLDRRLLERGRERFNIFCSPCHAPTGSGDGMIVQRGFHRPPSFHTARLRDAPVGHFFDVMTDGFGVMPRYGPQILPRDRWAIVAYIRTLQHSQNALIDDVPQPDRQRLQQERP